MAEKVVGVSLTLDSEQANKSVKNFKTELREAEQSLVGIQQKFGPLSKESLNAAKSVAVLKDQIRDAREVSDLFDPGAKFQAFGNVVRTVTGGFAALTGAMALFGAENKEIEKSLLKVQSALAITEGVNTLADSVKDWQRLNVMIQQSTIFTKANAAATMLASNAMKLFGVSVNTTSFAFKALKTAIISTGIGVLIIAVGFLVEKLMSMGDAADAAAKSQERLKIETDRLNESLQDQLGLSDRLAKENIAAAKARGASLEEITKLERKAILDRISIAEIAAADAKVRGADEVNSLKKLQDEKMNLRLFDYNQQAQNIEKQKALADKADADAKQRAEKEKQTRQERIQAEKAAVNELQKLRDENALAEIKSNSEAAKKQIMQDGEAEQNRIAATVLNEAERDKIISAVREKTSKKIASIEALSSEQGIEQEKKRVQEESKIEQARLAERIISEQRKNQILFDIKKNAAEKIAALENQFSGSNSSAKNKIVQQSLDAQKEIELLSVSEDKKLELVLEIKREEASALAELNAQIVEKSRQLEQEKLIIMQRAGVEQKDLIEKIASSNEQTTERIIATKQREVNAIAALNSMGVLSQEQIEKQKQKILSDSQAEQSRIILEATGKQNEGALIESKQKTAVALAAIDSDIASNQLKTDQEIAETKILQESANERRRIEALTVSAQTKADLILEINRKEQNDLLALEEEFENTRKQRDAERLAANLEAQTARLNADAEKKAIDLEAQLELEEQLAEENRTKFEHELALLDEQYQARLAVVGSNESLQLEILKSYEKQKSALVREENRQRLAIASDLLGQASQLFAKHTIAYKAIAVAQTTIQTIQSAQGAFAGMVSSIPGPVGIALGVVAAAAAVAAGIANVKKIVSTKIPGGGGDSGGSAPNISSTAIAPLSPTAQVQTTTLDQKSIDQTGNAAVRAFVVEEDVTNSQSRIKMLNRAARLGG